jgi:serine/threonine-protein kinase
MSLTGERFGSYEILTLLGAGAMGEVYRAHDIRLGREVALKILPSAFTADPDRLSRFEREARVLATLNHPNIGAIYGVEQGPGADGCQVRALVLELVEGETLAERITRVYGSPRASGSKTTSLRLGEALDIARQLVDALDAAHEKGIIHRDLKPANIKITPEGTVKVLDFGLAKSAPVHSSVGEHPLMATLVVDGTQEGLMLGTAAYMSPEQARGTAVDKRTDIWAFGCVLYEMLAGCAAFGRGTMTDTLVAILERDPDWTRLTSTTPPVVRRLLERCLTKDPKQRLRDIADARTELQPGTATTVASSPNTEHARRARTRVRVVVAAALLAAVGVALWVSFNPVRPPAGDRRTLRFSVELPEGQVMSPGFNPDLALSADGTYLAFASSGGVYVRRLDGLETQRLDASAGYNSAPLFSPDETSITFIAGDPMAASTRPFLKAALSGGAAVKLADYDMFHRGDWGSDGNIYWTASYPGGIVRISASGGKIQPVTQLDPMRGERSHRFANLLPGGRALIYTVGFDGIGSYDEARIDLWDLQTGRGKTLIEGGTSPVYSPSGHVIYARAGKLFAVPFDPVRQELTGSPFEVLDGVMMSGNTGIAQFSLSKRGDLAYVPGPAEGGHRSLVWVDRSGKSEPLPLPPGSYLYPRISPDGRYLAVETEGPNHDLFLYDFARAVLSKLTTDGLSHDPVWSPDGKQLVFRSWQGGGMTMWSMPADRSTSPVRLDPMAARPQAAMPASAQAMPMPQVDSAASRPMNPMQSPVSFSPDGKFLTFGQKDPQTQDDVWVFPLDGSAPKALAQSRFGEGSAKFSPDGRWVAYSSNESGQAEVYVQAFPGPGAKIQISNGGGTDPVWRRAGGELYYRSGQRMMAVSITTSPDLRPSAPKVLWEGAYSAGSSSSCGIPGVSATNYDVTADGQRFLLVRDDDAAVTSTRIVVVVNWLEEVRAKERARVGSASLR